MLYILIASTYPMGVRHHQIKMKEKFLFKGIYHSVLHTFTSFTFISEEYKIHVAYVSYFIFKSNRMLFLPHNLFTLMSSSSIFTGSCILVLITQNLEFVLISLCPLFQELKSEFVNMVQQIIFVFFYLSEADC